MMSRHSVLACLVSCLSPGDVVISTLGYTSRELHAIRLSSPTFGCFYCLGSMGLAIPVALGVSLARGTLGRTFVVEGDGALLMNLGGLATGARYGNGTLCAVVLDNRVYESTGGQPSHSSDLDLAALAAASGWSATRVGSADDLRAALLHSGSTGPPVFVAVDTEVESSQVPQRIDLEPTSIATSFQHFVRPERRAE